VAQEGSTWITNIISHLNLRPTEAILRAILLVTGNGWGCRCRRRAEIRQHRARIFL